jgi:tetratricopeptide (TPR) repeat protein
MFSLIALAYSGSLDGTWTLDDYPNILQNPRLRIDSFSPKVLLSTVYDPPLPDEGDRQRIGRPLSFLSFAANWYFGAYDPAGYRAVNIAIHALTAFVLFHAILRILGAPKFRGAFAGRAGVVAFIAAGLWALNPVQTQAVVYIVQRMAALACLFYTGAIWCYIRARESHRQAIRLFYYGLTTACYAAGVGSKENAILLPAALALVEFCFYQDLDRPRVRRCFWALIGCGLFSSVAIIVALAAGDRLTEVFHYSSRLFTPMERLLTQPRILLFYLSLLFYPVPTRLSIVHDVELSRSFWEPWTTLPAILAVAGIIIFGLWQVRRRPIAAFAILFFFLNHLVESSIVGLELVFEHRNYLPSLFIFLPPAVALQSLFDRYRAKRSPFRYAIGAFVIVLAGSLVAATHIRCLAWRDAKTLWEDARAKAPLSMRPLHNLAFEHYEKIGRREEAFNLYQQSLSLRDYNRKGMAIAHTNIANYHFIRGDLSKAREHLDLALAAAPEIDHVHFFRAVVLGRVHDTQAALDEVGQLLRKHPKSCRYNDLMAQLLQMKDLDLAATQNPAAEGASAAGP